DIAGGAMSGFIASAQSGKGTPCKNPQDPVCTIPGETDVMGYHDAGEIPNYWSYAKNFVLQDRMFQPNLSWSLPEHLFLVSGWSALCKAPGRALSCVNALQSPALPPARYPRGPGSPPPRLPPSTRPPPSAPARRTSPASSTPSCAAPTGAAPRSSSPGTTGAASTTTSCRPGSTPTGMGCGSPASS